MMQDQDSQIISEQNTMPLDVDAVNSALALQAYLQRYRLHPLDVSLTARVRYLTVWNMLHGNPVSREHAMLVRAGLYRLTGIAYTAAITVKKEQARASKERSVRRMRL